MNHKHLIVILIVVGMLGIVLPVCSTDAEWTDWVTHTLEWVSGANPGIPPWPNIIAKVRNNDTMLEIYYEYPPITCTNYWSETETGICCGSDIIYWLKVKAKPVTGDLDEIYWGIMEDTDCDGTFDTWSDWTSTTNFTAEVDDNKDATRPPPGEMWEPGWMHLHVPLENMTSCDLCETIKMAFKWIIPSLDGDEYYPKPWTFWEHPAGLDQWDPDTFANYHLTSTQECTVTFYTDPACSDFNITFLDTTYHNDTTDTFDSCTSAEATANCPACWEFDHWEVTDNIEVSNDEDNPTTVTIKCGGTLKAVFKKIECEVTFYTDPTEVGSINFMCTTYINGMSDVFDCGTSADATANVPEGYEFDHWEVTDNVEVSDPNVNPTCVTINCGGSLKAIFSPIECQVTFLTDPVCSYYYINFQCHDYNNGTTDTFAYGTSGDATAYCLEGWEFDHWEVTGNVEVSNDEDNPTCVTIKCGGTLKAVFKLVECEVTFLTDPVCFCYYINFQCHNYHNGTTDTFPYGTTGSATANCPNGWVFDHWETTGNVQVSSTTDNPTTVTIKCGGSLKAVCRCAPCEVTFLTDPVCSYYYINFQCHNYHNGTTDTFPYGTTGNATAYCLTGWEFDHWEVTGNVEILCSTTQNPVSIIIKCEGTLKAVFCPTTKPPDADFTWCPATPKVNEMITFDASASTPNGGTIVSCKWDFGDGNITTVTDPIITHVYDSVADYTVILNVTDSEGEWDTETKTLKVAQSPTACFTATHHSRIVTFNASASYDTDGYIVSYTWDFGDKNITTVIDPIIIHNYATDGIYNVTLTIIDNDGLNHSVKNNLTVRMFACDLNGDGKVNIVDIAIVSLSFGSYPEHERWNAIADMDENGVINIIDIAIVAKDFNKTL